MSFITVFIYLTLALTILVPVILLGAWSMNDASRCGKSPFTVSFIILFFFPLGWIAWLMFRPPTLGSRQIPGPAPDFRRHLAITARRYRQYLRDHPEAGSLPSKLRHTKFMEWESNRGLNRR